MAHSDIRAECLKNGITPPKPSVDELPPASREFNRVGTDFLKVDIVTALIFSGMALQTDDAVKKQRSRRVARKAYETIRKFAKGVDLTNDDAEFLSRDLARLKHELQTLGEVF